MNNLRHPAANSGRPQPLIISVLSGKGGVGKSVIAYNLGVALMQRGNRVLLVDADPTCGNLHMLANCSPSHGIHDVISGDRTVSRAVTPHLASLDLLASPPNPATVDGYSVTSAAMFMQQLHDQTGSYDVVVLDHTSGISKPVTVMAHASHINLLVVVPELTSIADGYGLFKYLIDTHQSMDCRLFINRVRTADEPEYIYAKFKTLTERFLATSPQFIGSLPESEEIQAAVAAQRSVLLMSSEAVVGQSFMRLAANLLPNVQMNRLAGLTHEKSDSYKTPATADIRM